MMQENGKGKIRVIIADDIAETRDNLSKLLYFEGDIEVVGAVGDGQQAVNLCKRLEPNVVLMDINMPVMDGITATETISNEVPRTSVVMMSVQGDQDYLRRSMLAGAREFLVKPFTGEELATAIRRVNRMGASRRVITVPGPAAAAAPAGVTVPAVEGRVFAVFSPKGGVGTTTIATNLAIALKMTTGGSVAIMDGSFVFGDVGVMLNIMGNKSISDLLQRMDELGTDILPEFMVSHSSGVQVLLAPPRPQLAELITTDHVRAVLAQMRRQFDYIVVDTWPSFQDVALSLLDSSEKILLVTTLEMTAVKNVKLFLEVSDLLGYKSERISLIVNQADGKLGIQPKDIEESLRHPVLVSLPAESRAISMSVNHGVPITVSAKDSQFSKAIFNLASQLVGDKTEAEAPAKVSKPSLGLFGRLRTAH